MGNGPHSACLSMYPPVSPQTVDRGASPEFPSIPRPSSSPWCHPGRCIQTDSGLGQYASRVSGIAATVPPAAAFIIGPRRALPTRRSDAAPAARSHTPVSSRDCSTFAGGPAFTVSKRLIRLGFRGRYLPGPRRISLSLDQSSFASRSLAPHKPTAVPARLCPSISRVH